MKRSWFYLFFVFVLLLAACTSTPEGGSDNGTSESSGSKDKEKIVVGLDDDPPQLDPHFSTAAVDRQVYHSLYDKLIDIDEDLEFVPQLANEWKISEDGKEYTFMLQEGVKFHDGTPFNAEAVKFNFERMLDPKAGSSRTSELASVESVEVVDEHTVKVHLKEPFSPFLSILTDRAGMMVSPTAVKEKGEDFSNSPVGTGPFKFVERVKQDKIVFERNEDYWNGKPKVKQVVYRPYSDENVRLTNLLSGSVDIINKVPPKDIEKIKNQNNITLSKKAALGFQGMYLNNTAEPFDNKKLRNALDLVVDREAIVKVALRGTAVPSAGPIPPDSWAYDSDIQVKERNIEKAKKLMAEAGYPDGFEFSLKITAKPVEEQIAQMIQSMAKEAGIKVNVEKVEFGTMLEQMDKKEFDAVRLGWSGRIDPDGNIHPLFHSEGSINYGYSNPEMDQLLDEARTVTEKEKRKELYSKAMELAQEESPYIFLYHEVDYKAYKNHLKGFKHVPDTMIRLHKASIE